MYKNYEIGRVIAVDTSEVTIELSKDLKALTHSTYEGIVDIGSINSYVIIPVGAIKIVTMVTRVVLTEEYETRKDKAEVVLPSSRRVMKATMVGTIDEQSFQQGITTFPILDSGAYIATHSDLDTIFGCKTQCASKDHCDPGFCISVGHSTVFPDYQIKINPDSFFGKHAAIIGNTGSGKSCSIATVLQSIIQHEHVNNTRFIILDTNGEYRAAFQNNVGGEWQSAHEQFAPRYISTDPAASDRLTIPYWFMNSDDFVRLFKAAPGVQRPVLLDALGSAKNSAAPQAKWLTVRNKISSQFQRIITLSLSAEKHDAKAIVKTCQGVLDYLVSPNTTEACADFYEKYPLISYKELENCFQQIIQIAQRGAKNIDQKFEQYNIIGLGQQEEISNLLSPFARCLAQLPNVEGTQKPITADCPTYFELNKFQNDHIESALSQDDVYASRARDNCSTMLMRINSLLEDPRFDFMFGSKTSEWPNIRHSLAAFLRDLIGMNGGELESLSDQNTLREGVLPFYDRQRKQTNASNVVIVDLSLLAAEVLENVTALLGRLIHEFLQRISLPESGIERGEFPVVLVLEEAQNYIKESRGNEEESISKIVFERIAREGRKFGLGLVIASQRPSELSKTVLSQCNSFIVHRLQNPEDLRYFKEIVPAVYGQMLEQLPALAPRNALVLGECIQAPALVTMRKANPCPCSSNPKFFHSWTGKGAVPNIEAVCNNWESKK